MNQSYIVTAYLRYHNNLLGHDIEAMIFKYYSERCTKFKKEAYKVIVPNPGLTYYYHFPAFDRLHECVHVLILRILRSNEYYFLFDNPTERSIRKYHRLTPGIVVMQARSTRFLHVKIFKDGYELSSTYACFDLRITTKLLLSCVSTSAKNLEILSYSIVNP